MLEARRWPWRWCGAGCPVDGAALCKSAFLQPLAIRRETIGCSLASLAFVECECGCETATAYLWTATLWTSSTTLRTATASSSTTLASSKQAWANFTFAYMILYKGVGRCTDLGDA